MPASSVNSRISFGLYEADLQTGELWKAGYRVKLQGQPFKVLAALIERPGKVVTRDELQLRLWGKDTVVDFDHSLGTAINKIREALGDSAENPRFIETLARRGYRFIAPVAHCDPEDDPTPGMTNASPLEQIAPVPQRIAEPLAAPGLHTALAPAIPAAPSRAEAASWAGYKSRLWQMALIAGIAAASTAGYIIGARRSTTSPLHMTQITHGGHLAVGLDITEDLTESATDGVHLFVPIVEGGHATLAAVPVSGGPLTDISIPAEVASPVLGDISPDGSRLLLRDHLSPESEQKLWVMPTMGGSALQVGDVLVHDATWMPDGKGILYAAGNELYLTHMADNSSQLFASLPGRAFWLRWDPTGKLLRFTIIDPIAHTRSLWQLAASDRKPRQILGGFTDPSAQCCGIWTADGSWFVFQATRGGNTDIWKLSGTSTTDPVRVTDGPLQFQAPLAARSGNRIFFFGVDSREQLERVTPTGDLIPEKGFLESANRVEYSRDRKWVAWTDNLGHLWRAAADGTRKLQLTSDTLNVFLARWSPDGSRLALMAREPGAAWRLYLVASNGGPLQPLLAEARNAADPSWSPDGNSLVFGRINDPLGKENAARTLHILNLTTRQIDEVPGSDALFSPRWSPDGHYIAALSLDQRQVRLFDVVAQTWKTLPVNSGADPVWSSDSRYLYLHESLDTAQPIDRIAIPYGPVTQIVRLSDSSESDAVDYIFGGLTPDNLPLVVARTFTGNMYSLALQ